MNSKKYKIKARVWKWPGDGGWHFVTLDKKLSAQIKETHGKGLLRGTFTIGKTSWETSLLSHKLSQAYLIAIKSSVRKQEGIFPGDEIQISFNLVNML